MLARRCGHFCWSYMMLHPCVQVRDIPAIVFGTIDHRIDTTFFKYAPDWLKVDAAITCLCSRAHDQLSHNVFTRHSFSTACFPPPVHGTCWASVLPSYFGLILLVVAPRSTYQNKEV